MVSDPASDDAPVQVTVEAPARLHLGFLDLNGDLGRRFGSLGVTLEEITTRVHARHAAELAIEGPGAARVHDVAQRLLSRLGLPTTVALRVETAIPEHVGLGSGTQLTLAVGVALAQLHGLALDAREVARLLQRGARSGIGIGAFESGGVLLDGGRGRRDEPPPLIARADFPEPWRILLIFDTCEPGIHGAQEVAAFRRLPPFPAADAAALCRLVLMRALPALWEQDLEAFGTAVGTLQRVIGDHFAPTQSGRFARPEIAAVLQWLEAQGIAGIGQSSWGPTGFAIFGSPGQAQRLLRAAQAQFAAHPRLGFQVVRARNHGARIARYTALPEPRRLNVAR